MNMKEIHSSAYSLSDIKCTNKKIEMQLLKGIEHTVFYWEMIYPMNPFVNNIVPMKSTICTSKKKKKKGERE